MADLDEVERALGVEPVKPKPKSAHVQPAAADNIPVDKFGDSNVDDVMAKLDRVVQRTAEVQRNGAVASPFT